MFRFLALLALGASSCSALMVTPAPVALTAPLASRAPAPFMACNGGKGGSGGMAPKLDKQRRGQFKKLVQVADSAENVKAVLLSSQTEALIMKMNWKVRKTCRHHLTKRAAQFGVEVPMEFAAFNQDKANTPKYKLTASIKERSPVNAGAVAALSKMKKW